MLDGLIVYAFVSLGLSLFFLGVTVGVYALSCTAPAMELAKRFNLI